MKVNVTVKRRIVFNGKEYGSVDELPENARAAYEKAVADGLVPGEGTGASGTPRQIVVNGQNYDSVEAMPPEVRRLYEDAMAAVASGHVAPAAALARTLPAPAIERRPGDVARYAASAAPIEPGSTGSPAKVVVALLAGLLLLGLLAYLYLR